MRICIISDITIDLSSHPELYLTLLSITLKLMACVDNKSNQSVECTLDEALKLYAQVCVSELGGRLSVS